MVYANNMLQCVHPIANDAEENPGPIVFHNIDPTSTHLLTLCFFSVKCYWLPGIFNFKVISGSQHPYMLYTTDFLHSDWLFFPMAWYKYNSIVTIL